MWSCIKPVQPVFWDPKNSRIHAHTDRHTYERVYGDMALTHFRPLCVLSQ